jgi:hypothetical protein
MIRRVEQCNQSQGLIMKIPAHCSSCIVTTALLGLRPRAILIVLCCGCLSVFVCLQIGPLARACMTILIAIYMNCFQVWQVKVMNASYKGHGYAKPPDSMPKSIGKNLHECIHSPSEV